MDALVYEESPLATYYEGHAIPADISGRTTPEPLPSFAPQGLPELRNRIESFTRNATHIHHQSSEQILEQFRYIIVASQLLSDEGPPRPVENDTNERDKTLLRGAIITAIISFAAAWTLRWVNSRRQTLRTLTWTELGVYCLAVLCVAISLALFTRRKYAKSIQRSAAGSLTQLVNDSHAFDAVAARTIRFIQEVELVARGYDISSTLLPPITRLEEKQTIKRCQNLRADLTDTLTLLISLYVESHNALQAYIVQQDVQRYHDIYEVSLLEYSEAIKIVNTASEESKSSLKELRFAFRLHTIARKVLLCDLLALRTTRGWDKVRLWRSVQNILRSLEEETSSRHRHLSMSLHQQEFGSDQQKLSILNRAPSQSETSPSQPSQTLQLQKRRFEDLAQSIRSLNAKVHVLREELAGLEHANTEESVILTALAKHYDTLGTDIRALQQDWERNRNSMLVRHPTSTHTITSPVSYTPHTPAPYSPTSENGTPSDALRILTGDRSSLSSDATLYDEEVFEAVSAPRKRMSLASSGLTREEKIAKMQEERKKRATLQEKQDATTNMLRELQMVIKHRPKTKHERSPSTPIGYRVSSI